MIRQRRSERGSAMVEAAVVVPCLALVVYASIALTDVLLLKLEAAQALRYALWEMTVFKEPAQIENEAQRRWAGLTWHMNLATVKSGLGGQKASPQGTGPVDEVLSVATSGLASAVDLNLKAWKFNLEGEATASVTLERKDPGARLSLTDLSLSAPLPSQRPMRLVFDTWKAWPRPARWTLDGAPTDVTVSPSKTYAEVEEQVARQVDRIAFFGLNNVPFVGAVRDLAGTVTRAGITEALLGGKLPDVLSAERMDGPKRGPITILPPDRDASDPWWVPARCEIDGREVTCPTQRLGDVTAKGSEPSFLDDDSSMGDHVDRSRYTVPYRINTQYWTESGGTVQDGTSARLAEVPARIATENEYVKTWQCRGHFFAGAVHPQETDASRRYREECRK